MRDNAGSNRVFLEGKHERAITVADIVKSITDAVKIYHYPKAGDPIHSMKKDDDGVHVPHGVNFTVIITGVHNDNREDKITFSILLILMNLSYLFFLR